MTDTPGHNPLAGSALVAGIDAIIESPRMEHLFGQLRIALSVAKAGIRADGLLRADLMLRISFENEQIIVEGLGDIAGSSIMGWLKQSLVDQGFTVGNLDGSSALVVEGFKRLSPHIH